MPEVGAIRKRRETITERWTQCPNCEVERWMRLGNYKRGKETGVCLKCYNKPKPRSLKNFPQKLENNPNWKGGRWTQKGYMVVRIKEDDFFYSMANSHHYVMEHRLVMAKHLGRCLHPWEFVHHKNGIKEDNRIENLQLSSADGHNATTVLRSKIKHLEAKLKPAPT